MTSQKVILRCFFLLILCLLLFAACDQQETKTEGEIESTGNVENNNDPTSAMLGSWYDPIRPRVSLTVSSRQGGGYDVKISWSDSAYQTYEWRFIGRAEDGEIVTGNCQKVLITYSAEDVFEEEVLYQNGSAKLYFDEDGKLCWHDGKEDAGKDCRFEKNEAIPS